VVDYSDWYMAVEDSLLAPGDSAWRDRQYLGFTEIRMGCDEFGCFKGIHSPN
jgi:hypothetical protein